MATATMRAASRLTWPRSWLGMASSMIDRINRGGTRATSAATTIVARKPTSMRR